MSRHDEQLETLGGTETGFDDLSEFITWASSVADGAIELIAADWPDSPKVIMCGPLPAASRR